MRYPASEKLEIIRIVEQSHLPAKRTLDIGEVSWRTPIKKNAMDVPIADKVNLLMSVNDAALGAGASFVNSLLFLVNEQKYFASTDGSYIDQDVHRIWAPLTVTAVDQSTGKFRSREGLPQAVVDWVNAGGTALLGDTAEVALPDAATALWRDAVGETLVEGGPMGAGRLLRFTRMLEPVAMPALLDADFAARLRDLITPAAPPPSSVVSTAFAPKAGTPPFPLPPRELSAWVGILTALVFLAERLLASRRRRFAP